MGVYVVRRLLLTASVVLAVSLVSFVGFGLSFDPSFPLIFKPTEHAFVRAYYHLNEPILERYWRWLAALPRHGFGTTVSTDVSGTIPPHLESPGAPIGPFILHAAANTMELVGSALLLVIVGSVVVGAVSAHRQRFRADVSVRFLAYLGAAVPTFLIGDLLRRAIIGQETFVVIGGHYLLSSHGGWFLMGPTTGGFVDWVKHMTLPAVTLALGLIGIYSRYIRTSMITTLSQPYVTVARAKGLSEQRVLVRHVLRNSLIPFVSLLSLEIGGVIGASLAADGVFNTGGLASAFLGALGNSDPFALTALFVTTAVVVSAFTFAGDMLVGVLDPRVRSG